jgi:hypothetical protein
MASQADQVDRRVADLPLVAGKDVATRGRRLQPPMLATNEAILGLHWTAA